jgi:hypothetical protein
MVMEAEFLRNPSDISFKILACPQKWRSRLRHTGQDIQDKWASVIRAWGDIFREKLSQRTMEEDLL